MKLLTNDNDELMEVSALKAEDGRLVVGGTIMGAMPIEAVLTPAELRKVFSLLSPRLVIALIAMFFRK